MGDIRAFKAHFMDKEKLVLTGFSFCVGEELRRDVRTVGEGEVSTDWVSTPSTLQTHLSSSIHDST